MLRLFISRQANYLSSATPVICPTVNQALKQAPHLLCLTCGVRHKARSHCTHSDVVSYMMRGGKKITLNFFYHHMVLSTDLPNVFVLTVGVCFLLLCVASDPDDPLTSLPFLRYNERPKELWKNRQRPLYCVCIKTRAHSPAISPLPCLKLLYALKNLKYNGEASL